MSWRTVAADAHTDVVRLVASLSLRRFRPNELRWRWWDHHVDYTNAAARALEPHRWRDLVAFGAGHPLCLVPIPSRKRADGSPASICYYHNSLADEDDRQRADCFLLMDQDEYRAGGLPWFVLSLYGEFVGTKGLGLVRGVYTAGAPFPPGRVLDLLLNVLLDRDHRRVQFLDGSASIPASPP